MGTKNKRKRGPSERKYSDVFLDYCTPLLCDAETFEEFEAGLQLAVILWNVGCLDLRPIEEIIREISSHATDPEADAGALKRTELFLARRRREFGHYGWLVGEANARDEGDEWIVRVEARGSHQ